MTPAHAQPSTASAAASVGRALATTCLVALAAAGLAQGRTYQSLARAAGDIARDYPYDLALTASRGVDDTLALDTRALLSEHLGKRPVVLLFWMTTCGPCRRELADLSAVIEAWRAAADFALVPVSLDFPWRRDAFHARAAEYPWTSYLDERREFPLVMEGGLNGVPQIFVFDAAGRQIFHRRKYRPGDLDALAAVLGI